MSEEKQVKILFEVESDGRFVLESMWATPKGNGYCIDNIPFFAYGVSWGDVVSAESRNGMLYFTGLLIPGGHSTIRLVFDERKDVSGVRSQLESMGCSSEQNNEYYVAVDVPPLIDYDDIRTYLDELVANKILDCEEACIA